MFLPVGLGQIARKRPHLSLQVSRDWITVESDLSFFTQVPFLQTYVQGDGILKTKEDKNKSEILNLYSCKMFQNHFIPFPRFRNYFYSLDLVNSPKVRLCIGFCWKIHYSECRHGGKQNH